MFAKQGCQKCFGNNVSKAANEWLSWLGVPNDKKHREVRIYVNGVSKSGRKKYYKVDGLDPEKKIIFEFLGNYYHRKP